MSGLKTGVAIPFCILVSVEGCGNRSDSLAIPQVCKTRSTCSVKAATEDGPESGKSFSLDEAR